MNTVWSPVIPSTRSYVLEPNTKQEVLQEFCADPEWGDSAFYTRPPKWVEDTQFERAGEIRDRIDMLLQRSSIGMPVTLDTDVDLSVPTLERKEPIFMVCRPVGYDPTHDIEICGYSHCESCGKEGLTPLQLRGSDELANPQRFNKQILYFVFPMPWANLCHVPLDTSMLCRDLIKVLCIHCLNEEFIGVSGYVSTPTEESSTEQPKKHPFITMNYLPYRYMFGYDLLVAIRNSLADYEGRWAWQRTREIDSKVHLHGYFTPRFKPCTKSARK